MHAVCCCGVMHATTLSNMQGSECKKAPYRLCFASGSFPCTGLFPSRAAEQRTCHNGSGMPMPQNCDLCDDSVYNVCMHASVQTSCFMACSKGAPVLHAKAFPGTPFHVQGRWLAVTLLLCFMGATLGWGISWQLFIDTALLAYLAGASAQEVFDHLDPEEFSQAGEIFKAVSSATVQPEKINAEAFARCASVRCQFCYFTMGSVIWWRP